MSVLQQRLGAHSVAVSVLQVPAHRAVQLGPLQCWTRHASLHSADSSGVANFGTLSYRCNRRIRDRADRDELLVALTRVA